MRADTTAGKESAAFSCNIKNISRLPIAIDNVLISCSCTTANLSQHNLLPGEVAVLTGSVRPSGALSEKIDETIVIKSEAQEVLVHVHGTFPPSTKAMYWPRRLLLPSEGLENVAHALLVVKLHSMYKPTDMHKCLSYTPHPNAQDGVRIAFCVKEAIAPLDYMEYEIHVECTGWNGSGSPSGDAYDLGQINIKLPHETIALPVFRKHTATVGRNHEDA